MAEELACTQIGNDLVVGTLKHQPEAVIVIAEEAQRFVPERTCHDVTPMLPSGMPFPDTFTCSECGGKLDGVVFDTTLPCYCSYCGARVIDKVVEE